MRLLLHNFHRDDALYSVLAAALVLLYVAFGGGGFPLDDSWIHQTYGRNLAETGQWAFIPGEPSAASTSPLYTVLLAVGYWLRVDYFFWAHFLGTLALAITALVGARMAARLLPQSKYAGPATGLFLVLAWHLVWAAASGMETMIFSMLTLVLIDVAWRELDDRFTAIRAVALRGAAFGILAALTTLTRPEGILLVGLIGLFMLLARPQGSWTGVILWGGSSFIVFILVLSPYLIFNYQITGGLLPDTAAAKIASVPVLLELSYFRRLWLVFRPLTAGGQLLLLPGVVGFVIWVVRRSALSLERLLYLLPVVWGVALIGLYAARLPIPFQHGRYVIPSLPSWILAGTVGLFALGRLISETSLLGRVVKRSYLIASAGVFAIFAVGLGPSAYRVDVSIIEEEMVRAALWVRDNLPEDELLAAHDIGALGYFAQRPIIDIAGLVTPEVVPFLLDKEAIYDYLRERDARYLMALDDQVPGRRAEDLNDSRLCPIYSTRGTTAPRAGGSNMVVYRLVWDGVCGR